jgi:hypothetical protein
MANGTGTLERHFRLAGEDDDTVVGPPSPPLRERLGARWGSAAKVARGKLGPYAKRVAEWRIALPGLAGVGLISAGTALRFGVWAGLLVAGVFCLRLDSRIR